LLCAAFSGLAVFLLLRYPAGRLRRMTRSRSKLAAAAAPILRLFRGRADAPPLGRRLLLSMAVSSPSVWRQLESTAGWVACSGSRYR
jgi:hypothetical protein